MLPIEIWEIILKKYEHDANLLHFIELKRVCRTWHAIITQITDKSDKWYPKCEMLIPNCFWSSLLEQQLHPDIDCRSIHEAKKHPRLLISLLRSRVQLNKLTGMNKITEKLGVPMGRSNSARITCIAALGHVIVTGNSDGCVVFYDITGIKNSLEYTINYESTIQDIQLWRKGVDIMAVISFPDQRIKHWDIESKREISGFIDAKVSLISSSYDYCYKMIEKSEEKSTLIIERRTDLTSSSRTIMQLKFGYKLVALSGEGDKVMAWMMADRHIKFNEIKGETCTICPFMVRTYHESCRYIAFKPHILAFIGEIRHFGFSIAGRQWKSYDGLKIFRNIVTSLLIHVELLIIGFKSGLVRIYTIGQIDKLEYFNFDSTSTELNIDSSAIISLKLTECNSEQHLVVASERKIHIVRFENQNKPKSPKLIEVESEND